MLVTDVNCSVTINRVKNEIRWNILIDMFSWFSVLYRAPDKSFLLYTTYVTAVASSVFLEEIEHVLTISWFMWFVYDNIM